MTVPKRKTSTHWTVIATVAIGIIGVVITLVAALLFVVGQSYNENFYYAFGRDISVSDLSDYTLMVRGVGVLLDILVRAISASSYKVVSVMVVFAFLLRIAISEWQVRRSLKSNSSPPKTPGPSWLSPESVAVADRWIKNGSWIFLLVVVGPLFMILFVGGVKFQAAVRGAEDASNYYLQARTKVVFHFKAETSSLVDERLRRLNNAGSLRLLAETKDVVIVFAEPCSEIKMINSFIISPTELVDRYSEPVTNKGPSLSCKPEVETLKVEPSRKRTISRPTLRQRDCPCN